MNDEQISFETLYKSNNTYELMKQISEIVPGPIGKLVSVIPAALKPYDLKGNVQSHRWAKKVYKFFFNLQDTTEKEREKFLRDLERSNKENASEVLLEMIDRLNNINKIDVLTNLMKAKIKEEITIENFVRLCVVLERIPYPDLCALKNYANDDCDQYSADSLLSAGVLIDALAWQEDGERVDENDNPYHLNSLGELMIKYGLSESM